MVKDNVVLYLKDGVRRRVVILNVHPQGHKVYYFMVHAFIEAAKKCTTLIKKFISVRNILKNVHLYSTKLSKIHMFVKGF